jgi:hypothetical protein
MSPFQILLRAVSAIPALSQAIDIRFNERNVPFVPNVIVPIASRPYPAGSAFDAPITLQYRSTIHRGYEDSYNASLRNGIRLSYDSVLIPEHETIFAEDRGHVYIPNTRVFIGIGRGGYLMNERGPISVLRNDTFRTGVLILNDTARVDFNRSCLSGSVARMQYHFRRENSFTRCSIVEIGYRAIWPHDDAALTIEPSIHLTSMNALADAPFAGVLSMPATIADDIYALMLVAGGVMDRHNRTVTNCNFGSLIDRLPEIRLSFPQSGAAVGIFPEDYIVFNAESNECILNFHRQRETWYFNPLAIPNVNVHVTANEVFICDTAP